MLELLFTSPTGLLPLFTVSFIIGMAMYQLAHVSGNMKEAGE